MQVLDHEPSDSRRCTALARRRNQKPPVVVTHPVTGNCHVVNTPQGTFHPRRLVAAMESVKSGQDPDAVMKLVEPFGLDGDNPRPDVLRCIFEVMHVLAADSEKS